MYFVINSGSSSLKFKVFDASLRETAGGLVERIGIAAPFLNISVAGSKTTKIAAKVDRIDYVAVSDHADALQKILAALAERGIEVKEVKAFGHRVVHGGEEFVTPTVITDSNIEKLRAYNALAPLHNPANIAGIDSCRQLLPSAANVAVFDTAFYRTIPGFAYMY